MKFDTWMRRNKCTSQKMAVRLGVSRQQVDRYRHEKQIPGRVVMPKVVRATKGQVGPADFYASASASAN